MNALTTNLHNNHTAADILRDGIDKTKGLVSLACSFSLEDVVIIDIAHSAKIPLGVFAIDTGRLNEETYEVAEALTEHYQLKFDWFFPQHDEIEKLEREKGLFSFRESIENRHECCHIRKVEPLGRALSQLSGWVTGMRRDQGITRSDLQAIERDALNGGIIKINPLVDWKEQQVMEYVKEYSLPTNRLYKQGYRSIGCAPCSRAIAPSDQTRNGRWWWESPEQKECGLHRR